MHWGAGGCGDNCGELVSGLPLGGGGAVWFRVCEESMVSGQCKHESCGCAEFWVAMRQKQEGKFVTTAMIA